MLHHTEFEALIIPHMSELRAYCRRLAASRWEAEDLCQEVLLRLFRSYRSGGSIEHAKPLLYTIARNLWIDAGRRKRLRTDAMEEASELALVELSYARARELTEWVAAHLTVREMKMLMLAAVYRYAYREIAEEMNCTVTTVRMALHRAKSVLRAADDAGCEDTGRDRRSTDAARLKLRDIDDWTHALLRNEPIVTRVTVS